MVTVKWSADANELWGLLFSDAVDNFFILDGEGIRPDRMRWDFCDGFPVAAELIPCLARIGSLFGTNCFPVPSDREFSGGRPASCWIRSCFRDGFAQKTAESEPIRCCFPVTGGFWPFGRPADGPIVGTGHAQKTPIRNAAPPPTQAKSPAHRPNSTSRMIGQPHDHPPPSTPFAARSVSAAYRRAA
jgi:hypothetical protein